MTHLRFSFGFPLAVRLDFGAAEDGDPDDEDGEEEEYEEEVGEEEELVATDCFCFAAAASIVSINETILSPDFKMQQHSKSQHQKYLSMCRFLFFRFFLVIISYREFFQHFLRLFVVVVFLVWYYLSLLLSLFSYEN